MTWNFDIKFKFNFYDNLFFIKSPKSQNKSERKIPCDLLDKSDIAVATTKAVLLILIRRVAYFSFIKRAPYLDNSFSPSIRLSFNVGTAANKTGICCFCALKLKLSIFLRECCFFDITRVWNDYDRVTRFLMRKLRKNEWNSQGVFFNRMNDMIRSFAEFVIVRNQKYSGPPGVTLDIWEVEFFS